MWNSLDPYDKGATKVLLKFQVQLRGRFCMQKRTAHTIVEQMRRYIIFVRLYSLCHRCFLSGVSEPLSPLKSQIVEALCIMLANKYLQSERTSNAGMMYCADKHIFYRRPKENLRIKVEVDTARLLFPPCPHIQFPCEGQSLHCMPSIQSLWLVTIYL